MDRDGRRQGIHHISQHPYLRCVAILHEDFLAPVVIEIGERERSAILQKIEAHRARDIGKRAIAVVGVEHVSFVAAPTVVGANQFVHHAPALFVAMRRLRFFRRIGNHLPPKIAVQIVSEWAGDHAVYYIQVRKSVVVEIPGIARPGPAAHRGSALRGYILKDSLAAVAEQAVAHRVFLIHRADAGWGRFAKVCLMRNPLACGRPHVGGVEILRAVVIGIEPGNAHTGAHVFDARLRRYIGECAIAVVAIKILATEIVYDVKIRPGVLIVVVPSATEAVARVVFIEARLFGDVLKSSVTIVAETGNSEGRCSAAK